MEETNKLIFGDSEYYFTKISESDRADYKGLRDMYYSMGGFKDGSYLTPFPRETTSDRDSNGNTQPNFFAVRKSIAHYENIFKPELDAKVDPIFSKGQVRMLDGSGKVVVQKFIDNPTKIKNESMSDFKRRENTDAELYGAVFEVCDGPDSPVDGELDLDSNFMEYVYYVTPLNTYAYGTDNDGSLNLFMYYEDIDSRNDQSELTLTYSDKNDSYIIRVWLRANDGKNYTFRYKGSSIIEGSIKDLETFPVNLIERNKRFKSNQIAKSAYLSELSICKKIYNLTSWYNDSFFKNCFALLVYNGRLPDTLDLSNSSLLQYFGEGVNQPDYIAPPTEHLDIQIREVERLVRQLQSNMTSTVAISAMASGDARKEADKRRIEKLKQLASNIQEDEMWLVNEALRSYIDSDYTYVVKYIDDFETLTKPDEIQVFINLLDTGYLKGPVRDQVMADIIKIIYSNDKKRGEELAELQISTIEETTNDTFNLNG